MAVPFWQPGTLYQPGATVQANIAPPVSGGGPVNGDFEDGDQDWTSLSAAWQINEGPAFDGTWRAIFGTPDGFLVTVRSSGGVPNETQNVSFDGGATWGYPSTPSDFVPTTANDGIGVADGFALWANNAAAGRRIRSGDGNTWVETTPLTTEITARSVVWVADWNLWVSAGEAADSLPVVWTSNDDMISWTARHTNAAGANRSYYPNAYSPELGIMVILSTGADNDVLISSDGITWTRYANATDVLTGSAVAIVWAAAFGLFIATDNDNFATSDDGITWTLGNTTPNVGGMTSTSLAYSPILERVVAVSSVSNDTQVYASYSDDGLNWTGAPTGDDWPMTTVIWSELEQAFLSMGAADGSGLDSVFRSADGSSWAVQGAFTADATWFPFKEALAVPEELPLINDNPVPVSAGQLVRARVRVSSSANSGGRIGIIWYDDVAAVISTDYADTYVEGASGAWRLSSVEANAPVGAVEMTVALDAFGNSVAFDNVEWDYAFQDLATCLIFRAIQVGAGFSGNNEPVWPTVLGNDVTDNAVEWEAVSSNRVVWRAFPILLSGPTEPTWPDEIDGEVPDNTIAWQAVSQRVEDENCPNTKEVAIAASKIFAGDGDIIAYSATVNPLDWTTVDDAGYLPFGLQTYGSQPVTALGLYRSNLVAFNAEGFQMWQVDEDPQNMALLDAVAVPCEYYRTPVPVMNDLVFLTREGIRSMGIAGASTNLQAGSFGKQIDPLVLAAIAGGDVPNALYFPGTGQYWCIFGSEAFVLTINGGKNDMSWSRYVFPSDIDHWTIFNNELMLRSGNKVWRVSADATLDDQVGATGIDFTGEVWWPYLDMGAIGVEKMLIGFDLVGTGEVAVSIAYDQTNPALVTTPYTVDADTLPGKLVPLPVSGPSFQMRLTFSADQTWEWQATNIYLNDMRAGS